MTIKRIKHDFDLVELISARKLMNDLCFGHSTITARSAIDTGLGKAGPGPLGDTSLPLPGGTLVHIIKFDFEGSSRKLATVVR